MDQDLTARWMALGPVDWGRDDPLALCADELWRATGSDPMADWRGNGRRLAIYADENGHHKWLQENGGNFLRLFLRAMRGDGWRKVAPETAPPLAVGLANLGGSWTVGLRLENGWWAFRMQTGAAFILTVKRAWAWQPE